MMRMLAAAFLIAAGPACAESILVEPGEGHRYVGDKFNARDVKQVLYEDRPCPLPLVNAKHMREFSTKSIAVPMKACWGRVIGGDVVVILENGETWRTPEIAYVTTSVDRDGNGVVTKSFYKR